MFTLTHKVSALILVSLLFITASSWANTFATIDRRLLSDTSWNNEVDFNNASQKEILTFAHLLLASESLAIDDLAPKVSVSPRQINMLSVQQVTNKFWQQLLVNYQQASGQSITLNEFRQLAAKYPPDQIREKFHQTYLYEQLRLAALFPKISSEIAVFSDDEIQGLKLQDKTFIFTFDDGPTAVNGNTDKLINILNQYHIKAPFFVLGERFSDRVKKSSVNDIQTLYKNQCVGSHGWSHKSHASWSEWQKSVLDTQTLLQKEVKENYISLFRPPYGQRKAESGTFFSQHHIQVTLWNIDSQDWSNSISGQQASDRVLTLMLLWRKGIILFHDVHAKAQTAVPTILETTKAINLNWLSCKML